MTSHIPFYTIMSQDEVINLPSSYFKIINVTFMNSKPALHVLHTVEVPGEY